MKRNYLIALLLMVTSATIFYSCKKSDNSANQATVNFRLRDDPANYDAVYLDVQSIEVTMTGSAAVNLTPVRVGVYNILNFKNGLDTLLLKASLPAGKISQIRLILGSNNSVVVNGVSHALNTPSAQESGVKLNLDATLVANGAYDFWLDFDAGKSIVATGSGNYNLKPVIRAYTALTDGRIKGYALPRAALITVYAVNGIDTFSAIPDTAGYYIFTGLPQATYQVSFNAAVTSYVNVNVSNVNATFGTTTDLGTTILLP